MDLRFKKIMIFIVVILLLGMTLFETLKQLIDPDISISKEKKIDMRTAAMVLGVKRVADAVSVRGLYP